LKGAETAFKRIGPGQDVKITYYEGHIADRFQKEKKRKEFIMETGPLNKRNLVSPDNVALMVRLPQTDTTKQEIRTLLKGWDFYVYVVYRPHATGTAYLVCRQADVGFITGLLRRSNCLPRRVDLLVALRAMPPTYLRCNALHRERPLRVVILRPVRILTVAMQTLPLCLPKQWLDTLSGDMKMWKKDLRLSLTPAQYQALPGLDSFAVRQCVTCAVWKPAGARNQKGRPAGDKAIWRDRKSYQQGGSCLSCRTREKPIVGLFIPELVSLVLSSLSIWPVLDWTSTPDSPQAVEVMIGFIREHRSCSEIYGPFAHFRLVCKAWRARFPLIKSTRRLFDDLPPDAQEEGREYAFHNLQEELLFYDIVIIH
jgi:hypothetical protein